MVVCFFDVVASGSPCSGLAMRHGSMLLVVDVQCLLHICRKCLAYSLFLSFKCVITGIYQLM
jgi:hypothetical protein